MIDLSFFDEEEPKKTQEEPLDLSAFSERPAEKKDEEESIPGMILRNVERGSGVIGTTITGTPGELEHELKREARSIKEGISKFLPEKVQKFTEEQHKKPIERRLPNIAEEEERYKKVKGKESLTPHNKYEAYLDSFLRDATGLALGRVAGPRMGFSPQRSAFISSVGNGAGLLSGEVGASPETQDKTRTGAMFLASMFNPGGARQVENQLYEASRGLLPPNAATPATQMQTRFTRLQNRLSRGDPTLPENAAAINFSEQALNKINNGRISIDELTQLKRDLNQRRASAYTEFGTNKAGRDLYLRNLNDVGRGLDEAIDQYGRTNPNWLRAQREADLAHGAIQGSQQFVNLLRRHKDTLIKGAIVGSPLAATVAINPTVAAVMGLTGISAYQAGRIAYQMYRSPALRNYYARLVSDAAQGNVVNLSKDLNKFAKEAEKDQSSRSGK